MTIPPIARDVQHGPKGARANESDATEKGGPSFGQMLAAVIGDKGTIGVPAEDAQSDMELDSHALIFNQRGYFGPPGLTSAVGESDRVPRPADAGVASEGSPQPADDAVPSLANEVKPAHSAGCEAAIEQRPARQKGNLGSERVPVATSDLSVVTPDVTGDGEVHSLQQSRPALTRTSQAGIVRARTPVKPSIRATAPAVLFEKVVETSVEANAMDRPAPRMPRPASAAGGELNVQIGLSPAGESLDLNIRLGKVSREQRVRLRQEIAQLLRRYGLNPGEIMLNGQLEPERQL